MFGPETLRNSSTEGVWVDGIRMDEDNGETDDESDLDIIWRSFEEETTTIY
jgi:hypothetical protein